MDKSGLIDFASPLYKPKPEYVLTVSWQTHRRAQPWSRWHVVDSGSETRVGVIATLLDPPLTLCGRRFNLHESRHEVVEARMFRIRIDARCQLCRERVW